MIRIILLPFLFVAALSSCGENGTRDIVDSILRNDYDSVSEILFSGGDSNFEYGGTPLLFFALEPECNLKMVELLLKFNADPNKRQVDTGSTAFLESFSVGDVRCVNALLKAGGDISVVDNNGSGVVYKAVESGRIELVQKAATLGGGVDYPRKDGTTPLMYAARAGNDDIVRFLIDSGAAQCVENNRGLTPRELAIASGSMKTVNLLLKKCNHAREPVKN